MALKIIIAGGRDFNQKEYLFNKCREVLYSKEISERYTSNEIIILSGKARGADKLGEEFAKYHGLQVDPHPAKWDDIEGKPAHQIRTRRDGSKYWTLAGPERNTEMAQEGNVLIAFWDGKSGGTSDMILKAHIYGLRVHVFMYNV